MKTNKVPYSVRLDPNDLKEIADKKYDLTVLIQKFVSKLAGKKSCPTCGQKLKGGAYEK